MGILGWWYMAGIIMLQLTSMRPYLSLVSSKGSLIFLFTSLPLTVLPGCSIISVTSSVLPFCRSESPANAKEPKNNSARNARNMHRPPPTPSRAFSRWASWADDTWVACSGRRCLWHCVRMDADSVHDLESSLYTEFMIWNFCKFWIY